MTEKKIQVGGQAVIEGVMMRGPAHIATAVRRADSSIVVRVSPFVTVTKSHPFYSLPIIRGFVSLIEMMTIGFKSLNFSAGQYELDTDTEAPKETSKAKQKFGEFMSYAVALVLAFLLFGYVPYLLSSLLGLSKQNILFNLFAGSIRIIFFVLYVYLISLMKDIRRVFEYHGAEHKTVSAYENKQQLTVNNVQPFSTIHPRCGTSFMFFVLLVAILVFSVIDTIVAYYWFIPNALQRLLYHLLFLPLISGISYEFLKLSEKNLNNPLVKIFTIPGMSLQKVTTQAPDPQQLEVAITSLQAALNEDISVLPYPATVVDGEWLSDYCRINTATQE